MNRRAFMKYAGLSCVGMGLLSEPGGGMSIEMQVPDRLRSYAAEYRKLAMSEQEAMLCEARKMMLRIYSQWLETRVGSGLPRRENGL